MDISTAVITCLRQYATFDGRARRAEFWWFALFNIVVMWLLGFIDLMFLGFRGGAGWGLWMHGSFAASPVPTLYWLAMLLPSLAVAVRRLHDTGRSGWWLLVNVIPMIGPLVLLWFLASRGTPGDNRFGSDPLDPAAPYRDSFQPTSVPRVPRH